jgi:hypothetical protein
MPQRPITFISRARDFQITLKTEGLPMQDANGIVVARTPGHRVHFTRGEYTAKTSQEIQMLRDADTYGREFWEVGQQPGAIHPPTEEVLADIMTFLARRQADKLRDIQEREEETHKRPEILTTVARALGELGDTEHGKRAPGRPKAEVEAA